LDEFFVGLALHPSCTIVPNREVVSGVDDAQAFATRSLIIELDRWRLVVVLQQIHVVLHLVDFRQFDAMAFELNGYTHFPARIAAAHIPTATTNAPCRIRLAHLMDRSPTLLWYRQPLDPMRQFHFA
jgi:hypothetical protein